MSAGNTWAAGCAALALLLSSGVAGATESLEADSGARREPSKQAKSARHAELAARAVYGDMSVGMLGVGLEGAYFLSPHFAVGGTVEGFVVDNGADPDYSEPGTLSKGYHGLLSVEYDALDFWVTPYARVAGGVGDYTRIEAGQRPSKLELVGQLQVGFVLRGGPLVARLSVAPTLYGKDSATAYSAAVGARF